MKHMAGRKRHSAEDIVRKLRRADELAAAGKTGEEIAAELEVSAGDAVQLAPHLRRDGYRRRQGAQGAARAERPAQAAAGRGRAGEGRIAGGGEGKILSPAAKRRAVDMLNDYVEHVGTVGVQSCWAGPLHLPTPAPVRRHPPILTPICGPGCAPTPPNTPATGSGRAWAALRYDERREVNKKKVHRLWRDEGLQVRVHSPRKRAGVSSIPPVEADAPKVVWAIDFQFDSTVDGKAIKIALDDRRTHPRVAAEHRGALDHRRAACRRARRRCSPRPAARRRCCGWTTARSSFPKRCNSFARQGRDVLHSTGHAVEQRLHRIVQQPATQGVPQPQPLEQSARGPRGDRRLQTRAQPPTPALGPGLPDTRPSTLPDAGTPTTPVACEIN